MTNNQHAQKKNIASLQVLKTLFVLMQDNYTMTELVDKLNENEEKPIFNNSVVSKYINTCRYCGIKILKVQNRYYVVSLPFGLNIKDFELDLINQMQNTVAGKMSIQSQKHFDKFLDILNRFSDKELIRIEHPAKNITTEAFFKAVQNQHKVRFTLKNKDIIDCIPLEVIEKNKKMFFNTFYENSEKLIPYDKITAMETLKDQFRKTNSAQTVVFKLKGALAKNYQTRENEHIITNNLPEFITVANRGENKELLLSRLLRYQDLCEIENPLSYREDMKTIINEALSNYGV